MRATESDGPATRLRRSASSQSAASAIREPSTSRSSVKRSTPISTRAPRRGRRCRTWPIDRTSSARLPTPVTGSRSTWRVSTSVCRRRRETRIAVRLMVRPISSTAATMPSSRWTSPPPTSSTKIRPGATSAPTVMATILPVPSARPRTGAPTATAPGTQSAVHSRIGAVAARAAASGPAPTISKPWIATTCSTISEAPIATDAPRAARPRQADRRTPPPASVVPTAPSRAVPPSPATTTITAVRARVALQHRLGEHDEPHQPDRRGEDQPVDRRHHVPVRHLPDPGRPSSRRAGPTRRRAAPSPARTSRRPCLRRRPPPRSRPPSSPLPRRQTTGHRRSARPPRDAPTAPTAAATRPTRPARSGPVIDTAPGLAEGAATISAGRTRVRRRSRSGDRRSSSSPVTPERRPSPPQHRDADART